MTQTVMTNKGPVPRSGRNRVLKEEGDQPFSLFGGDANREPTVQDHIKSVNSSFTLPPLGKGSKAVEQLSNIQGDVFGGESPVRRSRKKSMLAYADGGASKSIIQASVEVSHREQELTLARENHRSLGRGLLELWVNQVLDPGSTDLTGRTEPLNIDSSLLRGLRAFGLTRVELRGAGVTDDGIDRLYRGLYVYTIGFFDIMQEVLHHSEFRVEILSNVWRAFLAISESALKVAFKSEYLQLFQAQQVTASELLVAQEALAEAKLDSYNTEKALAWLTAAHAEERALRVSIKAEMVDLKNQLDLEQRAHQSAIHKYVSAVEELGRLQVVAETRDAKLVESALAHADVIQQRDDFKAQIDALEQRCAHVFDTIEEAYQALLLDEALTCPEELKEAAKPSGLLGIKAKSQAVKLMTEQLHVKWRLQTQDLRETTQSLFDARDQLRSANEKLFSSQEVAEADAKKIAVLEKHLSSATERADRLQRNLKSTTDTLEETEKQRAAAQDEADRLRAHVEGLEATLKNLSGDRDELQAAKTLLEDSLASQDILVIQLQSSLARALDQVSQLSLGMSIAMKSVHVNQLARRALNQALSKERAGTAKLEKEVELGQRTIRVLEGKLKDMEHESHLMIGQIQSLSLEVRASGGALESLRVGYETAIEEVTDCRAKIETLEMDLRRAQQELELKIRAAEQADELLQEEKAEVMRLYESLQEQERQMAQNSEERASMAKQMERMQQEIRLSDERGKRKEDMLQLEINRVLGEVRLERTKVAGLEMELEEKRRELENVKDLLHRKREKKRSWKALHGESTAQCQHLKALLDEKTEAVERLTTRLLHMDVDLAILIADRGRPSPMYGKLQPVDDEDDNYLGTPATPPTPDIPDHFLSEAQRAKKQQAAEMTGSDGDMMFVYEMWDELNRQSLALQSDLVAENSTLDAAKRAYEKSRATFYANPTDPTLKQRMISKEEDLSEVRKKRRVIEDRMNEIADYCRALQAKLRHYEHGKERKRLREIEHRANTRDITMRSELSVRVDEAEARARELQELLTKQKVAYDMLQAMRSNLDGELQQQENELHEISMKLQKITAEKMDTEGQLRQAKTTISYLESEIAARTEDMLKLQSQLETSNDSVTAVRKEMAAAVLTLEGAIRRQAADLQEERAAQLAAAEKERQVVQSKLELTTSQLEVMTGLKVTFEGHLESVVRAYLASIEIADPPKFLAHVQAGEKLLPLFKSALPTVPAVSIPSNFSSLSPFSTKYIGSSAADQTSLSDPLIDFLMPSFENVLFMISQIYVEKMKRDLSTEEALLGGEPGPRCSLDLAMYEYFVARYGARQSAEMHLAAFIKSVQRCKHQHAKIRMFARLLGLDEDLGQLPATAVDFYIALLNRIHARAGPLTSEAVEGISAVKCRVVAKACRDMLRASYTNLNEEAGNITEMLRAQIMGLEESQIDLESSLEVAFKCWCKQYKLDFDAILEVYDREFEAKDVPSPVQFVAFLHKLDAPKADNTSQHHVISMYRQAVMAGGPQPTGLMGKFFASAVLDQGFVGSALHLHQKMEPVQAWPPYDEFRLLQESWKTVRPLVETQLLFLDENQGIQSDVPEYLLKYKALELALEAHSDASAAWEEYRKVMTLYQRYRKTVERIMPFSPEAFKDAGIRFNTKFMIKAAQPEEMSEQPLLAENTGSLSSLGTSSSDVGGDSAPSSKKYISYVKKKS
ncbi:hypothetical protein CEUSTIGMA_g4331.t1 [Chlamydomonas eustigma]|uniref:Uncharacterized protein n=1 Tax=Chlamydomonas eustigma TaxID=1157962 RepID=A0A250X1E7_9CHLO|nr:hypothetical protein CEUSTIGMA_g4331.t1 [Chlamydomonas eustigma]|eukprot:GAX76885.1 hypothetical protein CEUSTIGMA_g4331.t1 [Chlamydomonas eustigma]